MTISDSYSKMQAFDNEHFTDEYKLNVFMLWYNQGKLTAEQLRERISADPVVGRMPSVDTLRGWIRDIFIPKAIFLDEQVASGLDQKLINQRIEMAERHALIGQALQEKGLKYLEEHDITSAKDALAAVIKGVEIEHEARIMPTDFLKKISTMNDDQIYKELRNILQEGTILDITPHDPTDHPEEPGR